MLSPSNDGAESPRPEPPEHWSAAEDAPSTQPEGSLVPPPREPPTAVSADAESPFPWKPRREPWGQPDWRRRTPFAEVANRILDFVDSVADGIARQLYLR